MARISIRRFRTRLAYDANTCATRQTGRFNYRTAVIMAGDIELNPGPDAVPTTVAPPGTLKVYHVNARSLKKQLGDLRACAPVLECYDIVAITETWINDTVADSELGLGFSNHTWFRRDRGSLGGGVACAVRSSLSPLRLPDPEGAEMILIRLQIAAVTVAVCYRPPADDSALQKITDAIVNTLPQDCGLIIVGDFNLPEVTWTASAGGTTPRLQRHSNRAVRFLDDWDTLGLRQWVCEPTRGDSVLDLVLTRRLPTSVDVSDSVLSTDHRETVATVTVPGRRCPLLTRRSVFNYKRADFGGLRRSLALIPWGLLDGVGVDEAVDTFYSLLNSAIADHVPTVVLRRRVPPWFDAAVRAALRLKEAAHRRMRRNPSQETKSAFSSRRREFKSMSSAKYYQYLRGLTEDFKTNPKRYWSFLKCLTNKSSISPVLRASDGATVSDDQGRADLLNVTFAAKFTTRDVSALPDTPAYGIDALPRFHVSEDAVRRALKSVPSNKACGPDNISARIICECAEELVAPMTKISNASLRSGVFPERWRQANIIPIYKKGDKKDPSNYRSVSLLPLFGKILERVVYDQLYQHVSSTLCNEQHGFIPRRSCVTNLSVYLQSAWEAISDGYQTDAIYTDYSAAFQSVNHSLLIHKLKNSYHLKDLAIKWFVSYLSDRRQRVIVNGKTSKWTTVLSGVPEGSLLAPLLF